MALVICQECGKQISDKAKFCVHCGCPLELAQHQGKLFIKTAKSLSSVTGPSGECIPYTIYFYTTQGELLTSLPNGATTQLDIKEPITIYASYAPPKMQGKARVKRECSDALFIPNDSTTRLYVTYQVVGFMSPKLRLNKVEIIDSE